MSRYIHFTKLKHLIFLNGGSTTLDFFSFRKLEGLTAYVSRYAIPDGNTVKKRDICFKVDSFSSPYGYIKLAKNISGFFPIIL
jgi:hypothetical protein